MVLVLEHNIAQVVRNYQIRDQARDRIRQDEYKVDHAEKAIGEVEVEEVYQGASQ